MMYDREKNKMNGHKTKKYQELWPGWETVELLGTGNYGKVYKIRKLESDSRQEYYSALKVISIPQSEEENRRFRTEGYSDQQITTYYEQQKDAVIREFEMMAQFRGTGNIVNYEGHRVVRNSRTGGYDVMIRMELLTPLMEYIKQNGLKRQTIIQLGVDICNALQLCGKKSTIHRDIKPANIMCSEYGQFKLGDFGVARTMESTTRGTVAGTYSFMAPEICNHRRYNSTVDIYSLGMVLYWLLNGYKEPFLQEVEGVPTAEQMSAALEQRLSGAPLPKPGDCDDALAEIVLKACSYDPAERYQTASEMMWDLQQLLHEGFGGGKKTAALNTAGQEASSQEYDTDSETVLLNADETVIDFNTASGERGKPPSSTKGKTDKKKRIVFLGVVCICILSVVVLIALRKTQKSGSPESAQMTEEEATTADAEAFSNRSAEMSETGDMLPMPRVIGISEEEAADYLEREISANIGTRYVYSDSYAEGTVISQIPAENENIHLGASVILTISKGCNEMTGSGSRAADAAARADEKQMQELEDQLDALLDELSEYKKENQRLQDILNESEQKNIELSYELKDYLMLQDALDSGCIGTASDNFRVSEGVILLHTGEPDHYFTLVTNYTGSFIVKTEISGDSAELHFTEDKWGTSTPMYVRPIRPGLTIVEFWNLRNAQRFKLLILVVD